MQGGQRRSLRPSKESVLTMVLVLPLLVPPGASSVLTSLERTGQIPDSTLSRDAPVEREIKGGEVHTYRVTLSEGQFLHLSGMPYKTRVVLRLFGPKGGQIVERKLIEPRSSEPLRISHVARIAGDYRLEVSAAGKDSPPGNYRLGIEELRAAKPEDETRVAAESAVADALQLRITETAESLPLSVKKYEEALALWRAAGDVRGEANALADLGSVLRLIGENHQALKTYSQALALWQTLNDQSGASDALLSMGLIARTVGDNRKALEYYEQALRLRRALKDGSRDSEILNGMALVHLMLAEYQRALDLHGEAIAICRVTGDRLGEAYALNNTGNVHLLSGDYRQAIVYYTKALEIRRELKHSRGEANTLSNIGDAIFSSGESRKALSYFYQALTIAKRIGNIKGEALALGKLGKVYKELGDHGKAADFRQQALLRYRKAGDREGEATTLFGLGEIYAATDADAKAFEHLQQAAELYRTIENPPGVSSALLAIADVKRKRNDLDGARADIESALKMIEDVRARVVRQDLRDSYLASNRDYYDSYIDLLMQLHAREPSKGFDGEALSVSERARARSLIDILVEARANIREGVTPSLLDRERSLHQRLNENVERLRLLDEKQTEARVAATRELEASVAEYEALQAQVRLNSPRYAALTQPAPLSVGEIQKLLDDDTILLEYQLGDKRSFLWAVTPTSVKGYALPGRAGIESHVRRMYELLAKPGKTSPGQSSASGRSNPTATFNTAAYKNVAANLSRILLEPVAGQLGKKRLLIVADGALQYLPFAALPVVSGSKGEEKNRPPATNHRLLNKAYRPLIADHEIISLPSASVLAELRREFTDREPAPKALAVLADPVFDKDDERVARSLTLNGATRQASPFSAARIKRTHTNLEKPSRDAWVSDFDRLRFSRQEADTITALLPEKDRLKALDFEASRATAQSAELGQYRILHFATHGLIDSKHPELSGLMFSLIDEKGRPQDGFLRFHEIYNLKLNAELVVLSACQTALGKEVRGEGLIGLTRGFMYAGAPRVVASLWRVDDRATAELMKRFYEGMLRGRLRPAAALRAAQVQMWKVKGWEAPFFWGGFVLQGEWK